MKLKVINDWPITQEACRYWRMAKSSLQMRNKTKFSAELKLRMPYASKERKQFNYAK
jgi:hypothetical protein